MENNWIRKQIFGFRDKLLPRTTGKDAHDAISNMILSGQPFMATRFGAVEIKALLYAGVLPPPINLCLHKYVYEHIGKNAGFFPVTKTSLKKYANLIMNDISLIDILFSWRPEEFILRKELSNVTLRCGLAETMPCKYPHAWTKSLENKRLLVIHPFAESIKMQYEKSRDKLFEKFPWILPNLRSLEIVKAVQSIDGNKTPFADWFEALNYMEEEIGKHDYDICLIGCGAYGQALAAHVKRMGHQAIHLGGSLQLFFGIRGKRWENYPFYNKYWISPSASERPLNYNNVENGCYW